MKTCTRCKMTKPAEHFPVKQKGERRSICKPCYAERRSPKEKSPAPPASVVTVQLPPVADGYTASSIKILTKQEAIERMPWLQAEDLAAEYQRDVDFVKRGLQACRSAGVSEKYFIVRYLQEDKSIPFNPEVDRASRILQGLIVED